MNTYSVTDLRHRTADLLQKASDEGIVYLVRHSKPEAALVDFEYLRALQEAYEDYLDTLEFDKATKEVAKKGKISLSKLEKNLEE